MKEYVHWTLEGKGTEFVPLFSVSAINVLIFVIYEAFFMAALDKFVEILRNSQMKRALQSGYFVVYAPALVWFGKQLETRSIEDGKEERGGLIGWIIFWFRRTGIVYTLLYAVPAVALIYAQLQLGSATAEAITGNVKGHLLYVDLEHLLETKEPDRRLEKLRPNISQTTRSVIDSRIVHYRVYEVNGNSTVGRQPCAHGSMVINSTRFEIRHLSSKKGIKDGVGSESNVSIRKSSSVTTSKAFNNIYCNETYGKFCLAYQKEGPNLDVVIGRQLEDKNGLNTSKEHSDRYTRIFLDRDWKKGEAETLIQLILPIVNDRYDDDPVVVIDAAWLLSLRKTKSGRDKVIPEECELVQRVTVTLRAKIVFIVLLVVTVILVVGTGLWKCMKDRTVLNESGTAKGLLWSYANELADDTTERNKSPKENPKIFISRGSDELDRTEPELIDVRPVYGHINHLENSFSDRSIKENERY